MSVFAIPIQEGPPKEYDLKRHRWLKWKPGTYVILRQAVEMNGEQSGERFMTLRLEKVGNTSYTVSNTTVDMGLKEQVDEKHSLPRRVGEATLDSPSGKRAVTIWESTLQSGTKWKENGRLWLDAEYSPLKYSSVVTGLAPIPIHREVKATGIREDLKVGQKSVACIRLEGAMGPKESPSPSVEWWSEAVPGGVVRNEVRIGGPRKVRIVYEVLDFGESRLKDPPPGPPERTADLTLSAGQDLKKAMEALHASGGYPFACGYMFGQSAAKPRPFRVTKYYTLRNGMTLRIMADKDPWIRAAAGRAPWPPHFARNVECPECGKKKGEACTGEKGKPPHAKRREAAREAGFPKDDPAIPVRIYSISVANTTMLLCCKGETWIPVTKVELKGDRSKVAFLPGARVLARGMSRKEVESVLAAAEAKLIELDKEIRPTLPATGRWLRYQLKGEISLLLQLATPADGTSETVSLLVVESKKPGREGEPEKQVRVEFEAVDLSAPLGERWGWALGPEWLWNPENPRQAEILKRRGQRR